MWIEVTPSWMYPIIIFLKDQVLLENKGEAHNLRQYYNFISQDDVL